MDKQLRKWSNLLRIGKKRTIGIAFNYRSEDEDRSPMALRRIDKRSRVTEKSRMLAEREAYISDRSCPLKFDWCWEHPTDKKHYKLRAPHLGRLIEYVDVPSDIRPLTIIIVLPAQTGTASTVTSSLPRNILDEPLVIPGPREAAVTDYCKRLESRATDEEYKADFRKVFQVTLENHLDLELILEDLDAGFFVQ